jgi:outer membrane protein
MKKLISIMFVLSALVASPVFAVGPTKIGIVNLEQILAQSKYATSLNADLSKQFQPRQVDINTAQRHLQDEVDKFTFESFSMSADDRAKLQQTINSDKQSLDQMVATFQKDFQTAQNDANNKFLKKLADVIKKIGETDHFDIIERAANVFYINNSVDITKQVIDSLNTTSD